MLRATLGLKLDSSMFALANSARAVADLLSAQARRLVTERGTWLAEWKFHLRVTDLESDAAPFLNEASRELHGRLRPHASAPSTQWLARVADLAGKPAGQRVDGHGSLLVERTRDGLLFVDPARQGDAPPAAVDLQLGGPIGFGTTEWSVTAREHAAPPLDPSPTAAGRMRALLDSRCARRPWSLRTRRAGDRFWPLGMNRDLELRRFMQARGVPRFDRGRMPLVVDADDRVLWVPGAEIAAPAQIELDTERCIEVQVNAPPDWRE